MLKIIVLFAKIGFICNKKSMNKNFELLNKAISVLPSVLCIASYSKLKDVASTHITGSSTGFAISKSGLLILCIAISFLSYYLTKSINNKNNVDLIGVRSGYLRVGVNLIISILTIVLISSNLK
jgi:hypothetical protein